MRAVLDPSLLRQVTMGCSPIQGGMSMKRIPTTPINRVGYQPCARGQNALAECLKAAFACMGCITVASAGICWQLSPQGRLRHAAESAADDREQD